MTKTIFFDLLERDDKGDELADLIKSISNGLFESPPVSVVDLGSLQEVETSPFAYWVSDSIRSKFSEFSRFDSGERAVKQGLATADDFRFVRAWWEVSPRSILDGGKGTYWDHESFRFWCRDQTFGRITWVPFAKGGRFSPFHNDVLTVVHWRRNGEEIKSRINPSTNKPYSNVWQLKQTEVEYFFRPGLTWPLRGHRLSAQAVPAGSIFSVAGKLAMSNTESG